MAIASASNEVLIFGGKSHGVFLGCYGCASYDNGSICSKYGKGGRYDSDSIFNRYGEYGSKYSSSSPWNRYGSIDEVPVVVDRSGGFHGYLTIAKYTPNAAPLALKMAALYEAANGDLQLVQEMLCGS